MEDVVYVPFDKIHQIVKQAKLYADEAYKHQDMSAKQEYLAYLKSAMNDLCIIFDPAEVERMPAPATSHENGGIKRFLTGK